MNEDFMNIALIEAKKAYDLGEIPVGCVIVKDNVIVSKGYNMREMKNNVLMHAEIVAIDEACQKLNSWRLDDCTIYVTLEPCMMCFGAIVESRIKKVYFGAKKDEQLYDFSYKKANISCDCLNYVECSKILSEFFENRRKKTDNML